METTATIIKIALIVIGVLQLILFFKIWIMTNDVKVLKNKFDSSGLSKGKLAKEIIELKYTGKIDEAKKILDENLESEVFEQLFLLNFSNESVKDEVSKVINRYEEFYKILNCEMPKELKGININNVRSEYSSLIKQTFPQA